MNPKRIRPLVVVLFACAMPLLFGGFTAHCINGQGNSQENSLCIGMEWCTDLNWYVCNPLPNAVLCPDGHTVTYFEFLGEAKYGTCQVFTYVGNSCPYCTIGIVCASGKGYQPSALDPNPCYYRWCDIIIYRNGEYCAG